MYVFYLEIIYNSNINIKSNHKRLNGMHHFLSRYNNFSLECNCVNAVKQIPDRKRQYRVFS